MKRIVSVLLIFILVYTSALAAFAQDTVIIDGIVYSSDMTKLINCTEKYSGGEEFSVPEGITEICTGAFLDNSMIKKVYLPFSLQIIGTDAFRNSRIETVYLPLSENLTKIQSCAFFGCKNLTNVYLCSSNSAEIGESAFKNCISLTDVYLPESLIPESAFTGCTSLKNVNLGKDKNECKTYSIGFTDINGNVTASSARTILRLAAEIEIRLANVHLSADVNRDGKITAADARQTLRVAAKLEQF